MTHVVTGDASFVTRLNSAASCIMCKLCHQSLMPVDIVQSVSPHPPTRARRGASFVNRLNSAAVSQFASCSRSCSCPLRLFNLSSTAEHWVRDSVYRLTYLSQPMMLLRSYVTPSAATTGSAISSHDKGHRKVGGMGLDSLRCCCS